MVSEYVCAGVPQRRVSILGVTGSVGASTLDLLRQHRHLYCVEAVTAHTQVQDLARIARDMQARIAVIADEALLPQLKSLLADTAIEAAAGRRALIEAASRPVDLVVAAIVGAAGLEATFAAARSGAHLALANKESLVCAGNLLIRAVEQGGGALLPVDSEHNAIFQCLQGRDAQNVEEIILTASGGPFRTFSSEDMQTITPTMALKHPTWSMGAKISIDSATLINKGLELIEAQHLFCVPCDRLSVLVHPQSVVHGLVRMCDGSVLAQMAAADMRVPLASALAWPSRISTQVKPLDLAQLSRLDFEAPDLDRFPGLALAIAAMKAGGGLPCAFNAANEVAVAAFLQGKIEFLDIPALISRAMDAGQAHGWGRELTSLDDVLSLDQDMRRLTAQILLQICA